MIKFSMRLFGSGVAVLAVVLVLAASGCSQGEDEDFGDFNIKREFLPLAVPGERYETYLDGEGGLAPYYEWTRVTGPFPTGLELDDDGRIHGTPTDNPGLYTFVAQARDSDLNPNHDQEVFTIRVGAPGERGPILAKVRNYEEILEQRHRPSGLVLTLDNPDDEPEDRTYSGYDDAAFLTGNALAAASFRYAATGDGDDLETVEDLLEAVDALRRITGESGLLARGFERDQVQLLCCDDLSEPDCDQDFLCGGENHPDDRAGEGDFEDYHWRGDAGKNDYAGVIFGLITSLLVVEDEDVRELAEDNLEALADHVWENDLRIVDTDGEPTTDGDLDGERYQGDVGSNGLNALLGLTWFKAAHFATGEARFREYYRELLKERDYLEIMDEFFPAYLGYETDWRRVHIAFANFFILIFVETDYEMRGEFKQRLETLLWLPAGEDLEDRRAQHEKNVLWNIMYSRVMGWEYEAMYDAAVQMNLFKDAPLLNRSVDRTDDPDIEKNPDVPEWALEALDVHKRPPSNFLWRENPYALVGGETDGREFPGLEMILPYWMGRYYGFISDIW